MNEVRTIPLIRVVIRTTDLVIKVGALMRINATPRRRLRLSHKRCESGRALVACSVLRSGKVKPKMTNFGYF